MKYLFAFFVIIFLTGARPGYYQYHSYCTGGFRVSPWIYNWYQLEPVIRIDFLQPQYRRSGFWLPSNVTCRVICEVQDEVSDWDADWDVDGNFDNG